MIYVRPVTVSIVPVTMSEEFMQDRPSCSGAWVATYTADFLPDPATAQLLRWEQSPEDRRQDHWNRATVYTVTNSLQDFWSLEDAANEIVRRLENTYRGYDLLATFVYPEAQS